MAQSAVYSQNVVGYVTTDLPNGYSLIANQLDVDGVDNVATVFPTPPDGTLLYQWDPVGQQFQQPVEYIAAGNGWYDLVLFNPATNTVAPSQGSFFLYNPGSDASVTMVGNVVQSPSTVQVSGAYSFLSIPAPVAQDLDTNNFPASDGMLYYTFSAGQFSQPYEYIAAGNGWYDLVAFNQQFPSPAVGTGFAIYNPNTPATWNFSFTVQ